MYRVPLNTAIAWTRREDRHQRGKQPLAVADGLLTTALAAPDPRVEWLYRQITQLKDVDRSVAVLLLDGFSYKGIAAIVSITESNVGVKTTFAWKRTRPDWPGPLRPARARWPASGAS